MTRPQIQGLAVLRDRIERLVGDFDGHWTLAATDLDSGEHEGIREDEEMPTASVIKIPILVAVYRAVEEKKGGLNDRLSYGSEHDTIGSGVLNKLSHGVELSLGDAAALMTIISNNVATNMCIDAIGGIDYVNETMRMLRLEKTTMFTRLGDPSRGLDGRDHYVTTARETCRLMEMIARGEAISRGEACEQMLRTFRRQQQREKLARSLPWNELNRLPNPKRNWVASKGGTYIQGVRNDAAIIHREGRTVVIAVFTERGTGGSGHNHAANHFMGRVGLAAWEWLGGE